METKYRVFKVHLKTQLIYLLTSTLKGKYFRGLIQG